MKTSLLFGGMMIVAGVAFAQDPCDGVTCESGWDGPFAMEVCYIDGDEDTVRLSVCYCVDNQNPVPRIRIEGATFNYILGVSQWAEMIWWSGMTISEELYQCSPPDEYGNCNTPPNARVDEEVWQCWYWTLHGQGQWAYYQLEPCGTNICVYINEIECIRFTDPNRCCPEVIEHDAQEAKECDYENYPSCIRGCLENGPAGRSCGSSCANQ